MSATAFIAIDDVDLACWPYFFFLTIKFIVIPLEDVISKLLLIEKFVFAYTLILVRGIINMFVFIILISLFFSKLKLLIFEFVLFSSSMAVTFNIEFLSI